MVSQVLSGSENMKRKFYIISYLSPLNIELWMIFGNMYICSLSACLVLRQKYMNGNHFEVLVKITKLNLMCLFSCFLKLFLHLKVFSQMSHGMTTPSR